MKVAMLEGPNRLHLREVPRPVAGEYEALCELPFGTICAGTDSHIVQGQFPWINPYPTVLGHESVGRVLEVGARVRTYKAGDLITRVGTPAAPDGSYSVTWGGFAEYGIARDHEAMRADGVPDKQWSGYRVNQVLPAGFDPAAAPMMVTWRETLSYATRLGLSSAKRVLVIGSGGNGLAFVAHARHMGASTVACVGAADREAATRQAGANAYFDYRAGGVTGDYDVIIDAVGKTGGLDQVLGLLAPGGTLGLYGLDDIGKCPVNVSRARGSFTFYNGGYDEAETHRRVVELVQGGQLDARLWLDMAHPWPLSAIGEALEAVRLRRQIKPLIRLRE
ncbi:MAG: zinc-binding dehydrogenase [Lentisphaerae bacterium]|nr:zinc-binding dehydrogenase [Lentisphaerota bacterium]